MFSTPFDQVQPQAIRPDRCFKLPQIGPCLCGDDFSGHEIGQPDWHLSLREVQMTSAPSRANISAITLPMPELVPVIIATLLSNRFISFSFSLLPDVRYASGL
jgi:hypothetical protein